MCWDQYDNTQSQHQHSALQILVLYQQKRRENGSQKNEISYVFLFPIYAGDQILLANLRWERFAIFVYLDFWNVNKLDKDGEDQFFSLQNFYLDQARNM